MLIVRDTLTHSYQPLADQLLRSVILGAIIKHPVPKITVQFNFHNILLHVLLTLLPQECS